MNLNDIVRRTALRVKLNKLSGSVVHHVALLKRGMEKKGLTCEMIKGFCVIPQTKEACAHYWIREVNTGLDLDVGFVVACLRSPELEAIHPVLLEELPEGLERSDMQEETIRLENESLYELYMSDPKRFWKEAPKDVQQFSIN